MKIGGLEKFTVTDYPGKISCVVFTVGCNFRCPFCQNRQLVNGNVEEIDEEEVMDFLEKRQGQLDGVVVTGGEAMIQTGLIDFLERIKDMGYLVKLDTNGSVPETLEKTVRDGLVDYVAMDIKAPLSEYDRACGLKVNTDKIEKSIDFVMGLESYEFRTTAVPGIIDEEAVEKISKRIDWAKKFYLQQFRPKNTLDKEFEDIKPLPKEKLERFKEIAERYVQDCEIRNI